MRELWFISYKATGDKKSYNPLLQHPYRKPTQVVEARSLRWSRELSQRNSAKKRSYLRNKVSPTMLRMEIPNSKIQIPINWLLFLDYWSFPCGARVGAQRKCFRRLFIKNLGLCKPIMGKYRGWCLPSARRLRGRLTPTQVGEGLNLSPSERQR